MLSQVVIKTLNKLVVILEENSVKYAIFGGLALQVWKRLRSTLDIDVMLIMDNEACLADLIDKLKKENFNPIRENTVKLGGINLLRLIYTNHTSLLDIKIDLAVANGKYQKMAIERRIRVDIFGKPMWFIRCEDLILLKILSNRPIDMVDAEELLSLNKGSVDVTYLENQAKELKKGKELSMLLKTIGK